MLMTLIALLAQQPAPPPAVSCTPIIPVEFKAWFDAHPLETGIVVSRAADLPAVTVATARLAVQPSKPLTGTHLATSGFEVKTAGRYSVAVGGTNGKLSPFWLDIAGADNRPLKSVGHGHGPRCSHINKIVDFELAPGKYTLLTTGLTSASPVRALIVPAGIVPAG